MSREGTILKVYQDTIKHGRDMGYPEEVLELYRPDQLHLIFERQHEGQDAKYFILDELEEIDIQFLVAVGERQLKDKEATRKQSKIARLERELKKLREEK